MPQVNTSFAMPQNHRHSFYGWHSGNVMVNQGPGARVRPAQRNSTPSNGILAPSLPAKRSSLLAFAAAQSTTPAPPKRNNIVFESDYQSETLDHMRFMEKQTMPTVELMDVQPELHWFMRPYLVDFLIEIHQTFRLLPETLYLTMNIVDRYVSKRIVYKRHYQLVGCAALLIAAKFEDAKDRVPTVQELSQMCCNAYDASAFTQMEGHVLSTIDWTLGHPTAEAWLRYEYACAPPANSSTHSVARCLLELTLFHRDFIPTPPSALAGGAMLLARYICRDPRPLLSPTSPRVSSAAHQIHTFVTEHVHDLSLILMKKYSHAHYNNASSVILEWFRKRAEMSKLGDVHNLQSRPDISDEEADSSQSGSPTPSIFSTPSHSMNRDDDDDDSLPVTPLSLSSIGDSSVQARPNGAHPAKRASQPYSQEVRVPTYATWGPQYLKPVAKAKASPLGMDVDVPSAL